MMTSITAENRSSLLHLASFPLKSHNAMQQRHVTRGRISLAFLGKRETVDVRGVLILMYVAA